MVHERMFDEDDPFLHKFRHVALELPGAREKVSHGRPAFHTVKVFAYYGASVKVAGEWVQHPQSIVLQADPSEREALRQLPGSYVPGYLGVSGWTGLDIDATSDWTELRELLIDSYRATAPHRLIAELDNQVR